jgi:hypothetical protein
MMFRASLFATPHRVMFFGGTLQALLDKGFWPLQTGDNYAGFGPVPVWPMRTLLPASRGAF